MRHRWCCTERGIDLPVGSQARTYLLCSNARSLLVYRIPTTLFYYTYIMINRRDQRGLFFFGNFMNLYVNFCPPYSKRSDTVTLDIPSEATDVFMQYANILADEKNISAKKAFKDLVTTTFDNLMETDYGYKNSKNAKRGRRSS